jgi:hypothetical protein
MPAKPKTSSPAKPAKVTAAEKPRAKRAAKVSEPQITMPPIKRDAMGRLTLKDTAELLGITDRTLRNWRDKDYCPAISSGGAVDMPRLVKWLEEKAKEPLLVKLQAIDQASGVSREEVEIRGMISDNLFKNLRYEKERKELISKKEMYHHLSTILSDVSMRLKKLGYKIGPDLSAEKNAEKCTQIVNKEVNKLLLELCVDVIMDMKEKGGSMFDQSDALSAEAEKEMMKETKVDEDEQPDL